MRIAQTSAKRGNADIEKRRHYDMSEHRNLESSSPVEKPVHTVPDDVYGHDPPEICRVADLTDMHQPHSNRGSEDSNPLSRTFRFRDDKTIIATDTAPQRSP